MVHEPMRIPALSLCFALLLGAASASAEEAPRPVTSAQLEAVVAGEVLVEARQGEVNRGQVIGLVNAPIALVTEIVLDTGTHDRWFPDMVESDSVSGSMHTGRTHLPLLRDRYWRLHDVHERVAHQGATCEVMRYSYDETYEEGNMEVLHGYWILCPHGDDTVVKYVINADLGVWLPGPVVTWAQRKMLPGIIEGLNEEADRRR